MRCNKVILGITLTCLFFSIGQSQWLETTITVDTIPYALIWNSTNNKVYCANYYSDDVTVIDGTNNSVIITIPVGDYPRALVWNSANNKVYCANEGSSDVTVIDGANNSVITTIPVEYGPWALAWNSTNNKVYCANDVSNNVTVIDGATDSVITTIAVGDGPHTLCWNSIQNRVYVANELVSSISVLRDVIGLEEERTTLDSKDLTPEIYPNPARDYFAVRLPLSADCQTLKIFDVSGKVIKEIATSASQSRNDDVVKVSLKGINPGIYFLRFGKETKKFIIAN